MVRLPLNITAYVCACGSCVFDPWYACTLPRQQKLQNYPHWAHTKNAHLDGLTSIGSGHAAHKHVCSVCLRSLTLSTLLHQGGTVWYGFIHAQVYSGFKVFWCTRSVLSTAVRLAITCRTPFPCKHTGFLKCVFSVNQSANEKNEGWRLRKCEENM